MAVTLASLTFTISFHSPFRVGAAYARDGVDAAVDRSLPLPADHVKGVMRSAARDTLNVASAVVEEVFGGPAAPSPWAWGTVEPVPPGWVFDRRHRVSIDEETHAALKDRLVLGETAWAPSATFEILQRDSLDRATHQRHDLVLRAAAAAVHGLGAWRRRGLGWVSIEPERVVTPDEVRAVLALREAGR